MQNVSEFLKASHKCKKNRENWYADELLELVAHIQEHANNKDITKDEYCGADGELREVKSGSWRLVSCDKCAKEKDLKCKM